MARNILKVEFSLPDLKNEKKTTVLDEIKTKICALLNTNGGSLVLIASDATINNKIHADSIIIPIEAWLLHCVGHSNTDKNFKWELHYDTITIGIVGPILCTLNTNLFLPTQSSIPMLREPDRIREILFERSVPEFPQQTVPEQFNQGCDSGLKESHSIQLKNLTPGEGKSMSLADRIIKNKLTSYVSGFANHSGGQIFYGIDDKGIVFARSLDEKNVEQIKTKVRNAIQKMIWPAELGEIQCGKQWNIKFVPVKECESKILPLTFVVVISILPCPGGVFTKEPESYHVVDGEVTKITFDAWKEKVKTWDSGVKQKDTVPTEKKRKKLSSGESRKAYTKGKTGSSGLKRKDEVPMEMTRTKWSSEKSEKAYMRATQELLKLRHLGKWQKIENMCKILYQQENQHINNKRVAVFHLIAVQYRLGDLENAKALLEELRHRPRIGYHDENYLVACIEERYSASAIERSYGNYQGAWEIIQEGLQLCVDVPTGLVPAAFYANAASVLSKLVDNESFIGVSSKDDCFKDPVQKNVETVEYFCNLALQHVKHIKDDFEIARKELKQRINTALASLYLKSESKNHSQVSSSDIDKAAKTIHQAENSLRQLKGTAYLKFNDCRILLVKADLCLRQYQLKKTDIDSGLTTEFFEHLEKAQEIAKLHGFKEIERGCEHRIYSWQDIKESLEQLNDDKKKIDESKSNEMLVREWLGSNDE